MDKDLLKIIKDLALRHYDVQSKGSDLIEVIDLEEGDVGIWSQDGKLYLKFDLYRLDEPDSFSIDL